MLWKNISTVGSNELGIDFFNYTNFQCFTTHSIKKKKGTKPLKKYIYNPKHSQMLQH